jgi:membrane-associated phospholipid phosphatase
MNIEPKIYNKSLLLLIFIAFFTIKAEKKYELNLKNEIYINATSTLLMGISKYQETKHHRLTDDFINKLDKNDINFFDRKATENWSKNANDNSDILLKICLVAPLMYNFSNGAKQNYLEINTMIAEAYFLSASITSIAKTSAQRTRPYSYNENVETGIRKRRDAQYSFFSGHTSAAFTGATMTALLFANKKNQYYLYSGAALTAGSVGYYRFAAGKHFPTDVIAGAIVGIGSAVFITESHKIKNKNNTANALNPVNVNYSLIHQQEKVNNNIFATPMLNLQFSF